jgi:hypothetical protein
MTRQSSSRSNRARTPNRRAVRPTLEGLEDRLVLSSIDGGQWSHPERITYSFMPDGTSIGGIPSNLFHTLNAVAPTATWEQAFEKAAAVWQQVTGINMVHVSDDGSPVGGSGDQQGDPRYGDIRIGAYPQQTGQLGLAFLPPPVNGGPDAGDLFINSNVQWHINNNYDLETVALHEIGHALGMGHSQTAAAEMYASYNEMKQTLNSDDVRGIQSIYGPAPSPVAHNQSLSTAIDLTPWLNAQGQAALAGQVVSAVSDYNWYKVTVPASTNGTMTVTMQSTNLSSLAPRLAVFRSNGASIGQSLTPNVYGSTVSYTVRGVSPGQVYYIRASAANNGPGSNGAYAIEANFGSTPQAAVAAPNTTVAQQLDQQSGSTAGETAGSTTQSGVSLQLGGLLGLGLKLGGGSGLSLNLDLLGLIDVAVKVQVGTLSVYAEALTASNHLVHHHTNHPVPPHHHHPARPPHHPAHSHRPAGHSNHPHLPVG